MPQQVNEEEVYRLLRQNPSFVNRLTPEWKERLGATEEGRLLLEGLQAGQFPQVQSPTDVIESLIGMPGRALGGLKDIAVGEDVPSPRESIEGVGRLGRALYQQPIQTPLELARMLTIDPLRARHQQGLERAEQIGFGGGTTARGLMEGLGQTAIGVSSLVSEPMAQIAETAGRGDLSRAAGMGAGFFGPLMAGAGRAGLQARGSGATHQGVLNRQPRPVRMTMGERSNVPLVTPLTKMAEAVVERTPTGGRHFKPFRMMQEADFIDNVAEQVIRQTSSYGGDRIAAARATQRAYEQGLKSSQSRAQIIYDAIDDQVRVDYVRKPTGQREIPTGVLGPAGEELTRAQTIFRKMPEGGVLVDTTAMKVVGVEIGRRIQEAAKGIPPQELARANSIVMRAARAPRRISFSGMQDIRSDLMMLSRSWGGGEQVPGRAAGVAKRLTKVTNEAMEQAAEQSGLPGLLEQVREANRIWAEDVKLFNEKIITRLAEAAPDTLPEILFRGDSLDAEMALRAASFVEGGDDALKTAFSRYLLDRAVTAEASSGKGAIAQGLGGFLESTGLVAEARGFRGTSLAGDIERLNRRGVLQAFFGEEGASLWTDLGEVGKKLTAKEAGFAPSIIAGGVSVAMLSPLLEVFGLGRGLSPVRAGSLALATDLFARITTGQAFNDFVKLLQGIERNNVDDIAFFSGRVVNTLNREQARSGPPGVLFPGQLPAEGAAMPVQLPPGIQR